MTEVIVNDNSGSIIPGDIRVYNSSEEASKYIEPFDVTQNNYVVMFSDGRFARLETDGARVWLSSSNDADVGLRDRYIKHAWIRQPSTRDRPLPEDIQHAISELTKL